MCNHSPVFVIVFICATIHRFLLSFLYRRRFTTFAIVSVSAMIDESLGSENGIGFDEKSQYSIDFQRKTIEWRFRSGEN
jgi:hypothetical protein